MAMKYRTDTARKDGHMNLRQKGTNKERNHGGMNLRLSKRDELRWEGRTNELIAFEIGRIKIGRAEE